MVDLSKFSVKKLANEGVDFKLVDDAGVLVEPGEEIPINFVLYGADAKRVVKARAEYNSVLENKNVKTHKQEEAALKFISKCVKSWDAFAIGDNEVKDGDYEALTAFFEECPMFRDQIISFVFEREHFLAK